MLLFWEKDMVLKHAAGQVSSERYNSQDIHERTEISLGPKNPSWGYLIEGGRWNRTGVDLEKESFVWTFLACSIGIVALETT